MARRAQKRLLAQIGTGMKALVPENGLYRLTHACVIFVPCPSCGAAIGDCCKGTAGQPTTAVHCDRIDLMNRQNR